MLIKVLFYQLVELLFCEGGCEAVSVSGVKWSVSNEWIKHEERGTKASGSIRLGDGAAVTADIGSDSPNNGP